MVEHFSIYLNTKFMLGNPRPYCTSNYHNVNNIKIKIPLGRIFSIYSIQYYAMDNTFCFWYTFQYLCHRLV